MSQISQTCSEILYNSGISYDILLCPSLLSVLRSRQAHKNFPVNWSYSTAPEFRSVSVHKISYCSISFLTFQN